MKELINKEYFSNFGKTDGSILIYGRGGDDYGELSPSIDSYFVEKSVIDPVEGLKKINLAIKKPNFFTKKNENELFLGLNISRFISDLNIDSGAELLTFEFFNKIYNRPFYLRDVSSSRREIEIFSDDERVVEDFLKNRISFKFIESYFISEIENYNFFKKYYSYFSSETYKIFLQSFRLKNSLISEQDLIFYLYDIFYGVKSGSRKANGKISSSEILSLKENIEFLLYLKYDENFSFDEIFGSIKEKIRQCVSLELGKNGTNDEEHINILSQFYVSLIEDIIKNVNVYIKENFFDPFRSSILVEGKIFEILNKKIKIEDGITSLVLKLESSIEDISEDTEIFIGSSEYESEKKLNVIVYSSEENFDRKKMTPDFSKNPTYIFEEIEGDSTKKINVDYLKIDNFVLFSNLEKRILIFKNKLDQINVLNVELNQSNIDILTANEINIKLNEIINGLDGFESYLYEDVSRIDYYTQNDSHINYDLNNKNSLVNSLPKSVRDNPNNEDYVEYLNLVGHILDNIWIYIDNFPTTMSPDKISGPVARDVLNSIGWDVSNIRNVSDIPWNRLLETVPNIINKKGTSESIQSVLNVYGIPSNLLNIKEFKEGDSLSSIYYKDYIKFSPLIKKNNEYIRVSSNENLKEIEFSLSLQKNDYLRGERIVICSSEDNWIFGIVKNRDIYYNLFFEIRNENLEYEIIEIKDCPLGSMFEFQVSISKTIETGSSFGTVGIKVARISDGDVIYYKESFLPMTSTGINAFASNFSNVYFGNYPLNIKENYFIGTLDEIKLWTINLTNKEFISHSTTYDDFSMESMDRIKNHLFSRLYVETPTNLNSNVGYSIIKNSNLTKNSSGDFFFYNFRTSNSYPFQFKREEVEQEYNIYNSLNYSSGKTKPTILENSSEKLRPDFYTFNSENPDLLDKIEVVYSPRQKHSEEILKIISSLNIGNFLSKRAKKSLDWFLRTNIETFRFSENLNDDIRKVKNYIDPSIFEQIESLLPSKSKKYSGILIEPSIMEKNFIKDISPNAEIHNNSNEEIKRIVSVESSLPDSYEKTLLMSFSKETTNIKYMEMFFGNGYKKHSFIQPFDIGTLKSIAIVDGKVYVFKNVDNKLNLLELPQINSIGEKNVRLQGSFEGNYQIISPEIYSINGKFTGNIFFSYSQSSLDIFSPLIVEGIFNGNISGTNIISSTNSNITISHDSDIYEHIRKNASGVAKSEIILEERTIKMNLVGTDNVNIRPFNKRIRSFVKNYNRYSGIYGYLTELSTVSSDGIPDGSIPFQNIFVDRGTTININSK